MKSFSILFATFLMLIISCDSKDQPDIIPEVQTDHTVITDVHLHLAQANKLSTLPLKCMQIEFPNKTGQVLERPEDLGTPRELHPAFYGCFDWHSSVHGHWSLVKLLKEFPDLDNREEITAKLKENITRENITKEIEYFNRKQEYSYERMYGWTWLLKLQEELDDWDTADGRELAANLQPLTDLLIGRYIEFLPKLNYPLRVGTHSNTAFGMSFAYDYAEHSKNSDLKRVIKETALRLYIDDKGCPLSWEPDGFDFLSPCLEEVTLMQRVLSDEIFLTWLHEFLPHLENKKFSMEPGKVSDREDGHLVHLDGLNFSRAWVFYRLAKEFPEKYGHLKREGDRHMEYSLDKMFDGSYEGEHWLASFALYAMSQR